MSKAELRKRRIRSVPSSESVIVEQKGENKVDMQLVFFFIKNVKFDRFFVLFKQLHVIPLQTNCSNFIKSKAALNN